MKRGRVLAIALLVGSAVWAASTEAVAPGGEPVATVAGGTDPIRLPWSRAIPVALRLGFTSEAAESHTALELDRISFEISRAVSFHTDGLPSCSLATLLYGYENAEQACAGSLVGEGTVVSEIPQREGAATKVSGRLLAYFDRSGGTPHILAQVTTGEPLPLVYVIPFDLLSGPGPFATTLRSHQMSTAKGICKRGHPNCFADPYGVDGIYSSILSFEMDLHRIFTHAGEKHSFLSARCPRRGSGSRFPLVILSLRYASSLERSGLVPGACRSLHRSKEESTNDRRP